MFFVVYGTHMFFVSLIKLRSKNRQGEFGDDVVTVARSGSFWNAISLLLMGVSGGAEVVSHLSMLVNGEGASTLSVIITSFV